MYVCVWGGGGDVIVLRWGFWIMGRWKGGGVQDIEMEVVDNAGGVGVGGGDGMELRLNSDILR